MVAKRRGSEDGPAETLNREEFARQVREALTRLYDVPYLQNHRLARMVPSSGRDAVGKALQSALREAIETLRSGEIPASGARTGRSYELLRMRFQDGLSVDEVCERLGISTREYYREYPKGLEAVTSVLWERWGLDQAAESSAQPAAPPGSPSPRRIPRLTQPLSSFVGRQRELARTRELLSQARLVTLVGPPGTGKTRLALAAAPLAAEGFPDGTVFVSLGTVRQDAAVMPAIAHALGLEPLPGVSPEERLRETLRDRRLLLVLDNFEQVVTAGPGLVDLLSDCPGIHALVTSRIRLNLRGERLLSVPPLAVPEVVSGPADSVDVEAVSRFDAVRLFCERAQEVDPDFKLDEPNAAVVVEICRRLDGLPLAIELAAARIDTLSPRRLLDQLRSPDRAARLELLASGASDLPARQQTLRDAIAWSYDLLDESDRAAFRYLSACVGGFDFAAADYLLASNAENPTLDRLEALLRRSLLTRETVDGEPRFAMLETLREFAAERLAASGEADRCAEQQARYFLGFAEAAAAGIGGREQRRWLDRLEREHPNLLAALAWFYQHAPGEGLRLAANLGRFWHVRGYLAEGRHWITSLLSAEEEGALPRARALLALVVLEDLRREARPRLEEAIEIFRTRGDENGLALALSWLAHLFQLTGQPTRDRSLAEEALRIARRDADPRTLATVLNHLADIDVRDGNFEDAQAHFAESIALWRALGDRLATCRTVTNRGNLARLQGDFDAARACFEEALSIQRAMGYEAGAAWQLSLLGNLARLRGDLIAARSALEDAVSAARELGGEHIRAVLILFLGQLLLAEGTLERGINLVAAAQSLAPNLKFTLDADEQADLDAQLTAARDALSEERYVRAWSTGEASSISEVIDLALGRVVPPRRID